MWTRLVSFAAALLTIGSPATTARAQAQYQADFPAARLQFLRGEPREAAYTVMLASAHLREELGRCKDGAIVDRMIAAEARLDGLVARLRAGEVSSVTTLDAAFVASDRLLAEHHVRLAGWAWANQRVNPRADIGSDLDRAAFHFVRGVRAEGRALDASAQQAVDAAQRLARQLGGAERPPSETGAVIAALARVITPPMVATERARSQ